MTAMLDAIVFKATPNGVHWDVLRDDKFVNAYSLQFIAERAATRLAKVAM
jgi:hypothetical protein